MSKVIRHSNENKSFEPVKLEIEITSENDLMALWLMLNTPDSKVIECFESHRYSNVEERINGGEIFCTDLWKELDNARKEKGIKK